MRTWINELIHVDVLSFSHGSIERMINAALVYRATAKAALCLPNKTSRGINKMPIGSRRVTIHANKSISKFIEPTTRVR